MVELEKGGKEISSRYRPLLLLSFSPWYEITMNCKNVIAPPANSIRSKTSSISMSSSVVDDALALLDDEGEAVIQLFGENNGWKLEVLTEERGREKRSKKAKTSSCYHFFYWMS